MVLFDEKCDKSLVAVFIINNYNNMPNKIKILNFFVKENVR